jgi:hypothetical protein
MNNYFTAKIQAQPSYTMPGMIVQQSLVSGFTGILGGGNVQARLNTTDVAVYMQSLKFKANSVISQNPANSLPNGVDLLPEMRSIPTYFIRAKAEYDSHDVAAAGNWNVSLDAAIKLALKQSHFERIRDAALYGVNAGNNEGILNAPNIGTAALPADSHANDGWIDYDNGELLTWLLHRINDITSRTFTSGAPVRLAMLMPVRLLNKLTTGIVQLVSYQREGAGSNSVEGSLKSVLEWNGKDIEFYVDNTLEGKGDGGTDGIILAIPELVDQSDSAFNTNVFASLQPNITANIVQMCDTPEPVFKTVPLSLDNNEIMSEQKIIPAWGLRPEAITFISAKVANT